MIAMTRSHKIAKKFKILTRTEWRQSKTKLKTEPFQSIKLSTNRECLINSIQKVIFYEDTDEITVFINCGYKVSIAVGWTRGVCFL